MLLTHHQSLSKSLCLECRPAPSLDRSQSAIRLFAETLLYLRHFQWIDSDWSHQSRSFRLDLPYFFPQ